MTDKVWEEFRDGLFATEERAPIKYMGLKTEQPGQSKVFYSQLWRDEKEKVFKTVLMANSGVCLLLGICLGFIIATLTH